MQQLKRQHHPRRVPDEPQVVTSVPAYTIAYVCEAPGCEDQRYARGFCAMHYQRWRLHGDPSTTKPPTQRTCLHCSTEFAAKGLRLHCSTQCRQRHQYALKKLDGRYDEDKARK